MALSPWARHLHCTLAQGAHNYGNHNDNDDDAGGCCDDSDDADEECVEHTEHDDKTMPYQHSKMRRGWMGWGCE